MTVQHDILLCDLDAFFASVEQLDRPELAGLPVIVGGRPEARGMVASCSYEARRFGVGCAVPVCYALRLCPKDVLPFKLYCRWHGSTFTRPVSTRPQARQRFPRRITTPV